MNLLLRRSYDPLARDIAAAAFGLLRKDVYTLLSAALHAWSWAFNSSFTPRSASHVAPTRHRLEPARPRRAG
jgi:hypothetical protein